MGAVCFQQGGRTARGEAVVWRCTVYSAARWHEEFSEVCTVKGGAMVRKRGGGRGGRAAELRGERQNLVVSPSGGDALQAPECTQTLSHRGAAQPERARHRALCERERGREEGRRTRWRRWE